MKKSLFCLLVCILFLTGCSGNEEADYLDEPNFTGEIVEVQGESIVVKVDEGEEERKSSDLMSVWVDPENEDHEKGLSPEDRVQVYYDGTIAESYPAQISGVHAIIRLDPSDD